MKVSSLALKLGELPIQTASYQSPGASTLPMFPTVHDTLIDWPRVPDDGPEAAVIVRSGAETVIGTVSILFA